MAPTEPTERERLAQWWRSWVIEIEDHPLDQFEYVGALEYRDEVETWLQISGDQTAMAAVADIDASLEAVTCEDRRFADHFVAQAGAGWWWKRPPSIPRRSSTSFRTGSAGRVVTVRPNVPVGPRGVVEAWFVATR